ncbi:hypothetical protein CH289_07705 [Rhodococcus sp. RS1C4]|nr:PBSX family phage terminase large subunit [Rhodococcus sp. RS1C4]OZC55071.1 hypothetical protein CH289_07705 [Rhodococcus sp. RS1C4]
MSNGLRVQPLEGKARDAYRLSTAEINAFDGSVRSGKTVGTLYDFAQFCIHGPEGLFCIAGRTQRTVINNLIIPMQEMFGANNVVIKYGSGTVDIFGREVLIVGANNEQARTKIQGLTLAAAYADEVATLPESFFDMLVSRLSVKGARMWCTCNPEGPRHWFKKKWLDRAKLWIRHDGTLIDRRDEYANKDVEDPTRPIDLHRFSFLLDDNKNLDPEYVARRKASYTGLFYLRMILGEWALADGVIYSMFDEDKHVIDYEQLPTMQRLIAFGLDIGANHPTAGILLGIGADNKLYAIAEYAPPTGSTDRQIADGLDKFLDQHQTRFGQQVEGIFVDPSALSIKLELTERNHTIYNASNKVKEGIRTIGSLLLSGHLYFSSLCPKLVAEIPDYVWDPKAAEKGEDKPIKIDDDFLDAARYSIASTRYTWQSYLDGPAIDDT